MSSNIKYVFALSIISVFLCCAGIKPDLHPQNHNNIPSYDNVLNSVELNKEFIGFLYKNTDRVVYLSVKAMRPYVGYKGSTCGPLFHDIEPEDGNDFEGGTQICFQNDYGEFFSEGFDENENKKNSQLYLYISDKDHVRIEGFFRVAGEIDRGRMGVWTLGLIPVDKKRETNLPLVLANCCL